jgi:hypothetical protein
MDLKRVCCRRAVVAFRESAACHCCIAPHYPLVLVGGSLSCAAVGLSPPGANPPSRSAGWGVTSAFART